MTVKLNEDALRHARRLIRDGKVTRDEHGDWSSVAPSPDDENAFIEKHGWDEYATWHLGIDTDATDETKGRYEFPYGDFTTVDRGGVITVESRAAEYHHTAIAKAAKELLNQIDGD